MPCTYPDFEFRCQKDNISVCLHKDLVCDSQPHCDDGQDERLDDCLEELIKKKLVSEDATLQCSSKIYENIETVVKACDGIEECADNSDELWLCTNDDIVVYIVIGIFSFIFIILILIKCHSLKNNQP